MVNQVLLIGSVLWALVSASAEIKCNERRVTLLGSEEFILRRLMDPTNLQI